MTSSLPQMLRAGTDVQCPHLTKMALPPVWEVSASEAEAHCLLQMGPWTSSLLHRTQVLTPLPPLLSFRTVAGEALIFLGPRG